MISCEIMWYKLIYHNDNEIIIFYGYNCKDRNLKNTSMKFNISGGSELERPIDFNLIICENCFY